MAFPMGWRRVRRRGAASLAGRELRHLERRAGDFDACWDLEGVDLDRLTQY